MAQHRKSSPFRQAERAVYKADRTALDIQAAMRGPGPLVKRLVRRKATRSGFGLLWRLLR